MARIESQAIAGFYATPEDQVPRIASLLQLEEYEDEAQAKMRVSVCDPCAGEGAAIEQVTRILLAAREGADARNEIRRKAENEVWRKEDLLRRVESARQWVKTCERTIAEKENGYCRSEKLRLRAVEKASARFRSAKAALQHALVAAGLAESVEPVVETAVAECISEPLVEEDAEEEAEEDELPVEEEPTEDDPVEDAPAAPVATKSIDHGADVYTCEMEAGRHKVLSKRPGFGYRGEQRSLHGDAFCANFAVAKDSGVGLLYLNPPYDLDKIVGRLEERFLRRFTDVLAPGGVLVFLVPYYALSASAETFSRRYEDVACYRFAGDAFNVYKQVVVFAKKLAQDRFEPDAEILARVNLWSTSGDKCPELPDAGKPHRRPRYTVPQHDQHHEALSTWKMKVVDVVALLGKHRPWHETTRRGLHAVSRVVPQFPLVDCMHRVYPVATLPRPSYVAAGLAAGLFNGQRLEPDDSHSKLPVILAKGVFVKKWVTIDENHNKDGEKTSEVQQEAPELCITVLDLSRHTYHTLRQDVQVSGKLDSAEGMSVGDLVAHYGKALADVMEKQCNILYDPRRGDGDKYALVEPARPLYAAQAHAVKAMMAVLQEQAEIRTPIYDGELGVGKTPTSMVAARSHIAWKYRNKTRRRAGKLLVTCPPHLLDTWRDEAKVMYPDADFRVLETVSDVDRVAEIDPSRFVIAVLSRSKSKLSHRYEGVSGFCPACNGRIRETAEDLARKRSLCESYRVSPADDYAQLARRLALFLRPYNRSSQYLPQGTGRASMARRWQVLGRKAPAPVDDDDDSKSEIPTYAIPFAILREVKERLLVDIPHTGHNSPARKAFILALAALGAPPETVLDAVRRIKPKSYEYDQFTASILLLLQSGGALASAFEILETFPKGQSYGGNAPLTSTAWFQQQYAKLGGAEVKEEHVRIGDLPVVRDEVGNLLVGGGDAAVGSIEAATSLLDVLGSMGTWHQGPVCGEPLYQAIPEPRIYPLAKYISRHHKKTFDFLIVDECHESNNAESAQAVATHQLTALGLPTILMTGTLMAGYAKSLFPNAWATDKDFRGEFARGDVSSFIDLYGYRKRVVSDKEDGKVVAFGTCSDRVERTERETGSAPGIHPRYIFRHLLQGTITLQKEDLRQNLTKLTQEAVAVEASPEVAAEFEAMLKMLLNQIKADRFSGPEDGNLAGKLFGQLSEIGSYLDRCTEDVGNGCGMSHYEVRYPESVGGGLVAQAKLFPKSMILPKEARMLARVESELAEGRRVMVFGWHLELFPRLQRLLQERLGEDVPVLYAAKVPTGKRQSWIDKHIVAKKVRCMVVNPVVIQTGLNNLRYFSTIWQHQNPACNPTTDRQSVGRIDRIGQTLPTRVARAYYAGTIQEKMYDLHMKKIAIGTATDGLDAESALLAAGAEPSTFLAGLSIGRELYKRMEEEMERPQLRVIAGGRRG